MTGDPEHFEKDPEYRDERYYFYFPFVSTFCNKGNDANFFFSAQ